MSRLYSDALSAEEITTGLKSRFFGRAVECLGSVTSTNDLAFERGRAGCPDGSCVVAEHQTRGRGRHGRHWESPKGKNILFSAVLRPEKLSVPDASKITLTAAVSLIRALRRSTGLRPGVKWPNDIVCADRKLCGILTEMREVGGVIQFVVVGIGINVNSEPEELPPGSVSLHELTGETYSRSVIIRGLFEEMEKDYLRLEAGDFEALAREWEEFSVTTGKRVIAELSGRKVEGRAMGIDADGALWIRHDNGLQERVLSADIRHLR